jgi:hypothetical protein
MTRHTFIAGLIALSAITGPALAEPIAHIGVIEGDASIMRQGGEKWITARPNMPLSVGDEVYCRMESFVEVRYAMGAVLRMDENSKITLKAANGDSIQTKTALGSVWVNMKKISKAGKTFDVSSPTAVASIRGTVYQMTTGTDSSTDVSVYDGKVAVGLTDSLKKAVQKPKMPAGEVTEVPGPDEIPGPFEVSLDQWKTIVAGQKIKVRRDGKFDQAMDAALMKE